jgi:hypothetical protein
MRSLVTPLLTASTLVLLAGCDATITTTKDGITIFLPRPTEEVTATDNDTPDADAIGGDAVGTVAPATVVEGGK